MISWAVETQGRIVRFPKFSMWRYAVAMVRALQAAGTPYRSHVYFRGRELCHYGSAR